MRIFLDFMDMSTAVDRVSYSPEQSPEYGHTYAKGIHVAPEAGTLHDAGRST